MVPPRRCDYNRLFHFQIFFIGARASFPAAAPAAFSACPISGGSFELLWKPEQKQARNDNCDKSYYCFFHKNISNLRFLIQSSILSQNLCAYSQKCSCLIYYKSQNIGYWKEHCGFEYRRFPRVELPFYNCEGCKARYWKQTENHNAKGL